MKNNFYKNRNVLYIILLAMICSLISLTTAYAALNAVLTIKGNADIVASTWDVHFDNVEVVNGSKTTVVPTISNGTNLNFSTELDMPGDYFRFNVDVVNAGDIDAMIENVVNTPDLTAEQAKYIKYDILN